MRRYSYIKDFKKRVGVNQSNQKDYTLNKIERNFLEYLETSPTSHYIQMTDPDEIEITEKTKWQRCIINDITQNDKRALDEKKVLVPKDANVDVGCYFLWDNCHWIIIFKEHKSLNTYKKFIARRCNQILNYNLHGTIYHIPVSIENLTMYSDGLADSKYTSQQDAKRMFTFGSNPVTRTIVANTRVMLTRKTVFRVTHINDFEYNGAYSGANGIIKTLVLQTTLIKEDDLVNNVAYNANLSDITEDFSQVGGVIEGKGKLMIGSKTRYKMNSFDINTMEWKVKAVEGVVTYSQDKDELIIQVTSNVNFTGEQIEIQVIKKEENKIIDSIIVDTIGFV